MKVLSFSEFIFENESSKNEVEKFLEDGYVIRAAKKGQSLSPNKIIISEDNPHSYGLLYCDSEGKEKNKIWIPRETVKLAEDGEDFVLTIHPDKVWINKSSNRVALEDFLEDYHQQKIENTTSPESLISDITADITTLLDTLDLPFDVEKIEQKQDGEFEITLGNGTLMDFKKGKNGNMFDSMDFYHQPSDFQPCLSISKKEGCPEFYCHTPELGKRNFSCELDEVPKDPYFNFLVRKCLGKETHGDGECLLKYLIDKASENRSGPSTETDKELETKKFLNDLKSVVSTYVPEEKLRQLLPQILK